MSTHQHGAQGASSPPPVSTKYDMSGAFLEVCDCRTICPCWTGDSPDEGECTGVFAWNIDKGHIGDVDVGGQSVVSVSTHSGHRDLAKQRVTLFVSEAASDEQVRVIAGAFSGSYGGPLGELSNLLGELLCTERAPISISSQGKGHRLKVGTYVAADTATNFGPSGRPMTLRDAKLSNVLGSPAEVAIARKFSINLPTGGIRVDLEDRSAMSGTFEYHHAPPAA